MDELFSKTNGWAADPPNVTDRRLQNLLTFNRLSQAKVAVNEL
jgi:hypothetical protein